MHPRRLLIILMLALFLLTITALQAAPAANHTVYLPLVSCPNCPMTARGPRMSQPPGGPLPVNGAAIVEAAALINAHRVEVGCPVAGLSPQLQRAAHDLDVMPDDEPSAADIVAGWMDAEVLRANLLSCRLPGAPAYDPQRTYELRGEALGDGWLLSISTNE